jgi:hypothetical protein
MKGLCLGLTIVFGLGWAATLAATAALPQLLAGMPGLAGPAATTVLGWAGTQTTAAMGLAAAGWLCAVAGARGWSLVALAAILPLLALAVVQFDPRIVTALQAALGPGFDVARGQQATLRLGLFAGLALIGGAALIAPDSLWGRRAVSLAAVAALGLMLAGGTAALLALPALALLVVLVRHGPGHPAAPYIGTGAVAVLIGSALILTGDSPRQDLRAGFVLWPVFAALAARWQPRLPVALLWLHAGLIGAVLAWLAPGMAAYLPVAAPTSLAEIAASLRRAEALRQGAGMALAGLALLGMLAFRLRRG